jgi:hypothetical protein
MAKAPVEKPSSNKYDFLKHLPVADRTAVVVALAAMLPATAAAAWSNTWWVQWGVGIVITLFVALVVVGWSIRLYKEARSSENTDPECPATKHSKIWTLVALAERGQLPGVQKGHISKPLKQPHKAIEDALNDLGACSRRKP